MNISRTDNFTYDNFIHILNTAKKKFNLCLLGDGLAADSAKPLLFIRHDVDVNINRALAMAEIEAERGIKTTYMFVPNSQLYDIRRDRKLIQRFVDLKHEVALHFDMDEHQRVKDATIADVLMNIERDCRIITDITEKPVRSVSFHRPMPQFLRGELTVAGRTNAYSNKLMESYISDSRGEWRNGEPLEYLQTAVTPVFQLLIHPIWWGVRHMKAPERLEEFYLEATAGLNSAASTRFDADLACTIPSVRRSNYKET